MMFGRVMRKPGSGRRVNVLMSPLRSCVSVVLCSSSVNC